MNFYDTCTLLHDPEGCFKEPFVICEQTLHELENIKTSYNKSDDIKYQARIVTEKLKQHQDLYKVYLVDNEVYCLLDGLGYPHTPDNIILACASVRHGKEDFVVCSDDTLCILKAYKIFGLPVHIIGNKFESLYLGYKTICPSNETLSDLYLNMNQNRFDCMENQYICLEDAQGITIDVLKWSDNKYHRLSSKGFKSRMFGEIRPLDIYQDMVFDSLINNEITVLFGRAGSGKTTIPLSYIMQELEQQKFRKCFMVHHFETLKGAKTLGFEKGSHLEKLLNYGAIGNILSSKFGDMSAVSSLIAENKLEIIPTANIRGVEFSEDDVVFVTECQNIDAYTLKTIIQRCKSGCKQIYEGDILEQNDIRCDHTGLERMIDVFKGHKNFGCVKLKKNYRGELGLLADQL